jgi:hypothetical protein
MYYGVDYNLHKDNQAISETIVLPWTSYKRDHSNMVL